MNVKTYTLKKELKTKMQVTQSAMECCMLGITRKDCKRREWIRPKTEVKDVIQSLKWQWQDIQQEGSPDQTSDRNKQK